MTNQTQPKPSEHRGRATMRIRAVSEVLRILQPQQVTDPVVLPSGLWKTGSLPKPQGAPS